MSQINFITFSLVGNKFMARLVWLLLQMNTQQHYNSISPANHEGLCAIIEKILKKTVQGQNNNNFFYSIFNPSKRFKLNTLLKS